MSTQALKSLFLLFLVTALSASAQIPEVETPVDPCAEGEALYREGNFSEARSALLSCLETGHTSLDVYLPLAIMGLQENRFDEAEHFSALAVDVAPEDAEARYWHGRSLLRLQRVEDARAEWEAGLQLKLNHQGILEGLARLSLNEGEPAKAYQLLDQMRRQGLDEAWLHRLLADIAASKGLWRQSLAHLKDALSREEPNAQDLLVASELSIMANDRLGAVDFCRQAVRLEPGAATYGGLGEAFFANDRMDSALVYLRLAVEAEPATARYRFNLANALEVTGQSAEAEIHFLAFLQNEPDDPVGHFNYGVHLEKAGRPTEGIHHVTRAVELDPEMLSARVVLAQMHEAVGHWDAALDQVALLKDLDQENRPQLEAWETRLVAGRTQAQGAQAAGLVHLLHMVIGQKEALETVQVKLAEGESFEGLVVQFSGGPAAQRGGDIGWINPADMVEPLRSAIEALSVNEISPPIESRGLYHLFKRIP